MRRAARHIVGDLGGGAFGSAPPGRGGARDLFVVEERFDPPIDLSHAAPGNPALSPCLQTYAVDWVASFIAVDGTQCRCVYDAADGDAVRRAYRAAGVPFTRTWRAAGVGSGRA